MALSFVMNEYVNLDVTVGWLALYEPIELRPVVKGSMRGHIYNGDEVLEFRVSNDGTILGRGFVRSGFFNNDAGVIKIFYHDKPHEENYLCISYEHGEDDPPQKSNWLQEGF